MRATFVLLTDPETQNAMRKLAVELDTEYGAGLAGSLLPAHVSLKQPFQIAHLSALEAYFDEWAASVEPFDVRFTGLGFPYVEDAGMGIVWLDVEESGPLRSLHDGLNAELAERFERTDAPFDGSHYRFHATVALGLWPPAVHKNLEARYGGRTVSFGFRVREVALFYYAADDFAPGTYMVYKVVSLGERDARAL